MCVLNVSRCNNGAGHVHCSEFIIMVETERKLVIDIIMGTMERDGWKAIGSMR